MSGLAKSLVAAVLTLPLVAFVAGVLSAPEEPAPDRSRPVIIGNVDNGEPGKQADRQRRERADDRAGDGDRDDDDGDRDDDSDDRPGPVTVVTPAPRDLGSDDDAVGDDEADDGDDESDDDSGGDD